MFSSGPVTPNYDLKYRKEQEEKAKEKKQQEEWKREYQKQHGYGNQKAWTKEDQLKQNLKSQKQAEEHRRKVKLDNYEAQLKKGAKLEDIYKGDVTKDDYHTLKNYEHNYLYGVALRHLFPMIKKKVEEGTELSTIYQENKYTFHHDNKNHYVNLSYEQFASLKKINEKCQVQKVQIGIKNGTIQTIDMNLMFKDGVKKLENGQEKEGAKLLYTSFACGAKKAPYYLYKLFHDGKEVQKNLTFSNYFQASGLMLKDDRCREEQPLKPISFKISEEMHLECIVVYRNFEGKVTPKIKDEQLKIFDDIIFGSNQCSFLDYIDGKVDIKLSGVNDHHDDAHHTKFCEIM